MQSTNKFTALHRILHWVVALAMPILFITGFLRMYWMNKNRIVSVIESKSGDVISKDTMVDIAKTIRAPMWEYHVLFAKVVIITILARVIYMLVKGIRFPNPFAPKMSFKKRFQGLTYVYFYVFVAISAFTGICIHYDLLSNWSDEIETVHKLGLYWFPIFVIFHLSGIFIAENSTEKGIRSKMIGGD